MGLFKLKNTYRLFRGGWRGWSGWRGWRGWRVQANLINK